MDWQNPLRELACALLERVIMSGGLSSKTMNINEFAKRITLLEGKKKSLSIAQVSEVIKLVLTDVANLTPRNLESLLSRYRKK